MNKTLTLILAVIVLGAVESYGQTVYVPLDSAVMAVSDSISLVDRINVSAEIVMDSTYVGKDIFGVMPKGRDGQGTVTVIQSAEINDELHRKILSSEIKPVNGYRIRIFLSSAQDAREKSIAAASRFLYKYPGYSAYRKYVSPNFKVTVGDFRSKSEALHLLNRLKGEFPSAFIVQEKVYLSY